MLDDPERTERSLRTHALVVIDPDVMRINRELLSQTRAIDRLMSEDGKGADNPDVRAARQRLAELDAQLDDRIAAVAREYLVRFELRRETLVRYTAEVDRAIAAVRQAVTVRAMVQAREREIEAHEAGKATAMAGLQQLSAQAAAGGPAMRVVQRASAVR